MSAPLTREGFLFTQRLLKSQGLCTRRLDGSWGPKTEAGLAATMGLEWGGNWTSFVDNPHYHLVTSKTTAQVRALFESGQLYVLP